MTYQEQAEEYTDSWFNYESTISNNTNNNYENYN